MDFNYRSLFTSDTTAIYKSKFSPSGQRSISQWLLPVDPINDLVRLRKYAKSTLAACAFFWIWAVYNGLTMRKGFDLGVISFALAAASSGYLLSRWGREPGRITRVLVLLTHLAVTSNYVLGVMFAFNAGKTVYVRFAAYCMSFTVVWLIVAYVGWHLITIVILNVDEAAFDDDDDDIDDLYNFTSPSYSGRGRDGRRRDESYSSYEYE